MGTHNLIQTPLWPFSGAAETERCDDAKTLCPGAEMSCHTSAKPYRSVSVPELNRYIKYDFVWSWIFEHNE